MLSYDAYLKPLSRTAGEGGRGCNPRPGEGFAATQFHQDRLNDTIGVLQNGVVREGENTPTVAPQVSGAPLVFRTVGVLATICFDDQLVAGASKVSNEWSDWILTPKTKACRPPIPQDRP